MRRKSIYEDYLRIQLEAMVLSLLVILLTIGCVVVSYRGYRESTRISYLHNQGVTLQIISDHTKAEVTLPKQTGDERID